MWYITNAVHDILYGIKWKNTVEWQYIPTLRNAIFSISYTSIYWYIHSICTVQVHHHTSCSFCIIFVAPCASEESQLHAHDFLACELATLVQLPQLTDHPGYTRKSKIYTYIHVYTSIYVDQLCRCCSLALLHSLDANSTWKRAGDVHTNSPPRQHQDDPPQCSKDMVELQQPCPAHTNNVYQQQFSVYTSIYKHIHQHSMNNCIPWD